jgi:hypothetical protein
MELTIKRWLKTVNCRKFSKELKQSRQNYTWHYRGSAKLLTNYRISNRYRINEILSAFQFSSHPLGAIGELYGRIDPSVKYNIAPQIAAEYHAGPKRIIRIILYYVRDVFINFENFPRNQRCRPTTMWALKRSEMSTKRRGRQTLDGYHCAPIYGTLKHPNPFGQSEKRSRDLQKVLSSRRMLR